MCFPQFGMMGPLSTQHGFARNVPFEVESQEDWKVTMVRLNEQQPGRNNSSLILNEPPKAGARRR